MCFRSSRHHRVEIQTPSLGLSASEVEELVTVPLEQSLQGMDRLDTIRSKSVPQLSSIELIFEPGTDLLEARQLVQERRRGRDANAAYVVQPTIHDSTAVCNQPGDEDWAHVRHQVTDRDVDDLVLDDQGAPAARARRCERGDLGRAPPDDAGAG